MFRATLFLLLLALQEHVEAFLDVDVFPPTCDGCYCIPDNNGNNKSDDTAACPSSTPQTHFSFAEQLKDMVWKNPIHLECNPYLSSEENGECALTDRSGNKIVDQSKDWGPDAVCGIQYDTSQIRNNQCFRSYSTQSFANQQACQDAGYTVTHQMPCGTCSSTQDLAVYMTTPDLQAAGIQCGYKSLTNETAALECYQQVGFSQACAKTWLYNTMYSRDNCLETCLPYLGKPPNLNTTTSASSSVAVSRGSVESVLACPLTPCIQCDEDKSGPIFKEFAGRTRRGSGLLSYIIRNCSELATGIEHLDPCPNGMLEGAEDDDFPDFEVLGDDASGGVTLSLFGAGVTIAVALLF